MNRSPVSRASKIREESGNNLAEDAQGMMKRRGAATPSLPTICIYATNFSDVPFRWWSDRNYPEQQDVQRMSNLREWHECNVNNERTRYED
jgi:hypothetical protein